MWTFLRRRTLTQWILVAMALGTLLGWAAPDMAATVRPLATVFLRMIKSIIVPLIFGTLVVGIAGHGDDLKRVGRLAFKAIVYFEVVTTLALAVGLVGCSKPGGGRPGSTPGGTVTAEGLVLKPEVVVIERPGSPVVKGTDKDGYVLDASAPEGR